MRKPDKMRHPVFTVPSGTSPSHQREKGNPDIAQELEQDTRDAGAEAVDAADVVGADGAHNAGSDDNAGPGSHGARRGYPRSSSRSASGSERSSWPREGQQR